MYTYSLRLHSRERTSGTLNDFTLQLGTNISFQFKTAKLWVSHVDTKETNACILKAMLPVVAGTFAGESDTYSTIAFYSADYLHKNYVLIDTSLWTEIVQFKALNATEEFGFNISITAVEQKPRLLAITEPVSLTAPTTPIQITDATASLDGSDLTISDFQYDQNGMVYVTTDTGIQSSLAYEADATDKVFAFVGAGSQAYNIELWHQSFNMLRTASQLLSVSPPVSFPIDDTLLPSFRAIYSFYRRTSYAGPTVQLRRQSDNALQDFNIDVNGDLTEINTWAGGSVLYIRTWYDQSGRGNNAVASSNINQPKFVNHSADFFNTSILFNLPDGTIPYGSDPDGGGAYTLMCGVGALGAHNSAFISAGSPILGQANFFHRKDSGIQNSWWGNDLNCPGYTGGNTVYTATFDGLTRIVYDENSAVLGTRVNSEYNCPPTDNIIGSNPNDAGKILGTVYEYYVCNRALTASEVTTHIAHIKTNANY